MNPEKCITSESKSEPTAGDYQGDRGSPRCKTECRPVRRPDRCQDTPSIQEAREAAQCAKERDEKVARMTNVPIPGTSPSDIKATPLDAYEKSDFQTDKARGKFIGKTPTLQCPNMGLHGTSVVCDFCGFGTDKKVKLF